MTVGPTIVIDDADELEALLELSVRDRWGDGFPLIPPTSERVERMLSRIALDPDHILGKLPPSEADATVRNVIINAVMAGCAAQHLPFVLAAVEAMCRPQFNIRNIQVTTHSVGVGSFVSGPLGDRAGINSGSGCLGPGNRANATIGRAIRLVMRNVGQSIPGISDKATHSSPANYSWFFAENQQESPWPSWAERYGAAVGESVVAVFPSGGFYNFLETTPSADQLLEVIAHGMGGPACNDMTLVGSPLLIIGPEHAQIIASGGYSVADVQEILWRSARLPASHFSASAQRYRLVPSWTRFLGEITGDTMIPVSASPEDIRIVVCGGPGRHTVYVPACLAEPPVYAAVDPYAAVISG